MKHSKPVKYYLEILDKIRSFQKSPLTRGLDRSTVSDFLKQDHTLQQAIVEAGKTFSTLHREKSELLSLTEEEAISYLQNGIENFYPTDSIQPYIPLCAAGPWIITTSGAVVYETGGYGMLGQGHSPQIVLQALAKPQVMANIMTPSLWHRPFVELLRQHIGFSRKECPYDRFLFLNSGSESVAVAARLSDLNAKKQTDQGAPHEGKTIKLLSLERGFHGRTQRAAQASDSTMKHYQSLASFRDRQNLLTVEPNNLDQLRDTFQKAEKDHVFIEAMFMEPVMGEGSPGKAITPEFYAEARRLTRQHHALLLVDSIQAAIRARGCLSIVDYPGFEQLPAPDMETFSKAINAGQFPLSVLALRGDLYQKGLYGNTMTSNPRAMAVGMAVLNAITEDVRKNIIDRGKEALEKLQQIQKKYPGITRVQGTGLLFSVYFDSQKFKASGQNSLEELMRKNGINVIHGGVNALRFTPHFQISSAEIDLIIKVLSHSIESYPQQCQS